MTRNQVIKYSVGGAAVVGAAVANAAGLTVVADSTAFLSAIDLSDTRTIILSVGGGLAVVGALGYAIRRGLRMFGI